MKKILIAYPAMMLGGSTTSLLSILNNLDYSQYSVDLLLSFHNGDWMDQIPQQVHVLPPLYKYPSARQRNLHRILSPRYMLTYLKSKQIAKKNKSVIQGVQYLEMKDVDFYGRVDTHYDIAVAFLEGMPCKFVAKHVHADHKIAWIHVDYKDAGFLPDYDRESLLAFDKIIQVSDTCNDSFCELFPELRDRSIVIENILSNAFIRNLAQEEAQMGAFDPDCLNLVTTCRIAFRSKALDRALKVLARIKEEGYRKFHWYVIGDGVDMALFRQMISDFGMNQYVTLLGMQKNPYKYMKPMSLFFLPSLWEGKPMAVTEAFILGLPVFVTEYSSAHEQVKSGMEGMVVPNDEEGIYRGLVNLLNYPEQIENWRAFVASRDYSNVEQMKKIEHLFAELG